MRVADPDSSTLPGPPSAWNVANALTLTRIALVPLFGWLLLGDGGDNDLLRILAFATFALAMATDKVDGDLARSRGLETNVGKVADPIADKALTGAAFIGLSILELLPWWVTMLVLFREIGITLLRFAVIRHGVMPASRGGKIKTTLQAVALSLYVLPLPAGFEPVQISIMAVTVAVTVVTGLDYVAQALRMRQGHAT